MSGPQAILSTSVPDLYNIYTDWYDLLPQFQFQLGLKSFLSSASKLGHKVTWWLFSFYVPEIPPNVMKVFFYGVPFLAKVVRST